MLYRDLGSTGVSVSILGIGVMRFPEVNGRLDWNSAEKMMIYAIENGINYIDTAYPYHGGESEKFLGEFLATHREYRDEVYVTTKMPTWLIKRPMDMKGYFDEQMIRLKNKVDFYILHTLKRDYWELLKELGVFSFLDSLRDEDIKVGFSFHDETDVFFDIMDSYDWDIAQIQFNIVDDHQGGVDALRYAHARGAGTVIMEPLRGGSLVENIPEEVQEIYNLSSTPKKPVEWCFRYLWNFPEVNVVLSGMSNLAEIKENICIASSDYRLTDEDEEILREVKRAYRLRKSVPCSGCGYCMPCPEGVDIPRNLRLLNESYRFKSKRGAETEYLKTMSETERASNCSGCGSCMPCPQMIDIPETLKKVHEKLGH